MCSINKALRARCAASVTSPQRQIRVHVHNADAVHQTNSDQINTLKMHHQCGCVQTVLLSALHVQIRLVCGVCWSNTNIQSVHSANTTYQTR